jgi:hypothetical protein
MIIHTSYFHQETGKKKGMKQPVVQTAMGPWKRMECTLGTQGWFVHSPLAIAVKFLEQSLHS